MNIIARIVFAAGVSAIVLGLGRVLIPVGDALWAGRLLFRTPIEIGESARSPWLRVDDAAARVGLGITTTPRYAARQIRRDGDDAGLYRFPLHYRVRDDSGRLLIDQWVMLDATDKPALRQDHVERRDSGPVTVDAVFDAFAVPRGSRIRIQAMLLPDRVYGADIERAELHLFRQPPPPTASIRQGLMAALAGLTLMLLGLLGELSRPASPAARPVPAAPKSRVLAFRPQVVPPPALPPAEAAHRHAL
jgi:hypothetical protein